MVTYLQIFIKYFFIYEKLCKFAAISIITYNKKYGHEVKSWR